MAFNEYFLGVSVFHWNIETIKGGLLFQMKGS